MTYSKDELPGQAEVAEDGEPQEWVFSNCACLHVRLFTSVHFQGDKEVETLLG